MRKIIKILLAGFSVLLLVLGITAYLVSVLIDPNDYKNEIATLIKRQLGYDVRLEGNITLSLFPWLDLKTEKIVLNNPPNFRGMPFMIVDKSAIQLKWLPLLNNKVEINALTLEGLTLNLSKNSQGLSNWSDFNTAQQPSSLGTQNNLPLSAAVTMGGVNIKNAHINWDNQQTEEHLAVKNIQLAADKLVVGVPINITLSMSVGGEGLKFPGNLTLNTVLNIPEKLDGFTLSDSHAEWLDESKRSSEQRLAIVLKVPSMQVSFKQQTFEASKLQLGIGVIGLSAEVRGEQLLTEPSIHSTVDIASFNPRLAMKQWGIKLPALRDAQVLSDLTMQFQLQATANKAAFTDLDIILDDSQIRGSATITDFNQPIPLTFDLVVDTIDLDRYLPPPEKPTKATAKPKLVYAPSVIALPMDWFKKLDTDGKLVLGKLKFNDLLLQDVDLTLSSKMGIVKTK